MMLYIVTALHNTGHGIGQALVLATPVEKMAIETARKIEALGYQFYAKEDVGVSVYAVETNRAYSKTSFRFVDTPPLHYPVLLHRRKAEDVWHEEWFNKEAEKKYTVAMPA